MTFYDNRRKEEAKVTVAKGRAFKGSYSASMKMRVAVFGVSGFVGRIQVSKLKTKIRCEKSTIWTVINCCLG
jgi:hypothetical protein